MIFGNPAIDRVQLNEESIWDGEMRDRNNPRASEAVPKIRELLFAGKIAEAEALATSDMFSIPRRMPCYQTLGDLRLDFSASGLTPETKVEDYRLELDLDTAIATTRFRCAGTSYVREVFSSAPDQAADAELMLRAKTAMERLPGFRITRDGRLQEWPEDYEDQEPGHRHISHLWGLYPDDQITLRATPELSRLSSVIRAAFATGARRVGD